MSASTGLVVSTTGDAKLLTPNDSIFRLLARRLHSVVMEHDRYPELGWAPFEVLPRADQQAPAFVEKVARYAFPARAQRPVLVLDHPKSGRHAPVHGGIKRPLDQIAAWL